MNKEKYIVIEGWMCKLGLTPNELLVFAIVYGFSQSERGAFTGRLEYIARMINITKRSVIRIMNRLVEKELVVKEEGNMTGRYSKCSAYSVRGDKLSRVKCQNVTSVVTDCHAYGCQNVTPIYINKEKDIEDIDIDRESKERWEKMFEEFWNEYPNHKAKQGAVRAFKSINPDEELFETMMGALRKVKRSKQWKNVQYVPNASNWLNQKRWEDEIQENGSKDNIKFEETYDIARLQEEAYEIKEFKM